MDKTKRKTRCWACGSLDVLRWGTRLGRQRFKCKSCDIFFTSENQGVRRSNELVWFRKWIIERQTIPLLSRDSGLSERTLKRKFYDYLEQYPQWTLPKSRAVHIVLDGTYFKNEVCLLVYLDNELKNAILYRTTAGEYTSEIEEDLINIMSAGIVIVSITSDGKPTILKAIKGANKWIKAQNREHCVDVQPIVSRRCLVHVQRNCLDKLKEGHQSIEGQRLRKIAMTMCKIDSYEKRDLFVNAFNYWFTENYDYVTQYYYDSSGKKQRVHEDLFSAYYGIKRALPSMFHYLDNDKIPSTTNSMEGYFSHLKSDTGFHRGLSLEHFRNFVRWYVYFKNHR